ncbi:MAG: sulfatase-like hydrolase/transferase [Acidobacteria bacterium]|nr:sulfatase-like hydrolase/transferase [Acidobacteriota bacterium]
MVRPSGAVGAIIVLILAAGAAVWWLRGDAYTIETTPDQNVLLVTIDTLRADALSSYGGRAATPHLDQLAAQGARFTFAHAHAVVTLPSHASILTGLLPYEHGIRDNSGFRLPADTPTLATRLKSAGFSTGAFIGAFPLTRRFGLATGFDVYDDQISELQGDQTMSMPERPADEVVSRAIGWIDRTPDRFFAWVHVFDPHSPYAAPDPFRAEYADQPYHGEVAFVDHALGPLFERLRSLDRPTLVIVTSDHGESLGEHNEPTHGLFAYEATLRVPLIIATVSPDDTAPRGRVIDVPARHVDIAPTVLRALDLPGDDAWTGAALQPVVASGRGADRPAYFESMTYHLVRGWPPLRGVIVEREKFIDQPIQELYDLETDPGELRNVAHPRRARTDVLAGVLKTFDVALPSRPGRESSEVSAALRSLGYVSGSAAPRTVYTEADDLKNLAGLNRRLYEANDALFEGDYPRAIDLLAAVLDQRPDTADAIVAMARAYWAMGNAGEAVAVLDRALSLGVTADDVLLRLGLYLAESRLDVPRAITVLRSLPDDDVEALNALGVAYGAAGRWRDAIATFERILTIDSGNALAMQNIAAMYLSDNDLPSAERFARQAVERDPALAKGHTTLGVVFARSGRRNLAIDEWKRAVSLDRTEFDALYNLVVLLAEAGLMGEARTYAKQFVDTAPRHVYAREVEQLSALLR